MAAAAQVDTTLDALGSALQNASEQRIQAEAPRHVQHKPCITAKTRLRRGNITAIFLWTAVGCVLRTSRIRHSSEGGEHEPRCWLRAISLSTRGVLHGLPSSQDAEPERSRLPWT